MTRVLTSLGAVAMALTLCACSAGDADVDGAPGRKRLLLGDLEPHVACRESYRLADGTSGTSVWRGSADGVPWSITDRGPDGSVTTEWFRQDGSDVDIVLQEGDRAWHRWQTLDDAGRVVEEGDVPAPGVRLWERSWVYDADGTLVGYSSDGGDYYEETWALDDEGRMVSMARHGEGYPLHEWSWSWDELGRLSAWSSAQSDGRSDVHVTDWSPGGLPTSAVETGLDWRGDSYESAWSWAWDDHDHLVSQTSDAGTLTMTWTYYDDGSYRAEGDFLFDRAFTWDADGALISSERDGETTRYTWGADGVLRGLEHDDASGALTWTATLSGTCPEAAWASSIDGPKPFGPIPAPPYAARPYGR